MAGCLYYITINGVETPMTEEELKAYLEKGGLENLMQSGDIDLSKIKTKEDAVQKPSAKKVLQPTPSGTREARTTVFENLKKWLTQIYNTIKGSSIDIELTQEVRDVFGGLLGAKAEGTLAEEYENIPKEGKLSTKNAVKTLINDNFEEIKKQLENKKICQ